MSSQLVLSRCWSIVGEIACLQQLSRYISFQSDGTPIFGQERRHHEEHNEIYFARRSRTTTFRFYQQIRFNQRNIDPFSTKGVAQADVVRE